MKHKFFYLCLFATLSIQTVLHAECIDLSLDYTAADIQAVITNKVSATTITADSYEICFINEFETDAAFTITSTGNDKIILKGLKIKDTVAPFINGNTLLTLSSANITVDGGFFTGNGSGTAIQVNGSNIEVKNSTIEKFEKGIVVGENGSVKLSKNTFSLILEENIYIGASQSSINRVGKYLNKDDPPKVDYVVGEMDALICSSSVGTVEMYLEPSQITAYFVKNHGTAKCSAPAFLTEDVTLEFADKHKETLKKDVTCAFKCDNLSDTTEKPIAFAYTTANGATNDFAPMPFQKYVDLPDVITITGTYVMPSTPSGSDGSDVIIVADNTGGTPETPDTTTLGDVPINTGPQIDPITGQPKAASDNTGGGSSDSGLVNQSAGSSGGCSVTSVMGAANPSQAKACYSFIFALLGLVPIAWRRVRKQF